MAKRSPTSSSARPLASAPSRGEFDAVLAMTLEARTRAMAAVNTTLIDLYWQIGEYLSGKIADDRVLRA